MQVPFEINKGVIDDWKRLHGLDNEAAAHLMGITASYFSRMYHSRVNLNPWQMLKLMAVTGLTLDRLVIPNFKALPGPHQKIAMAKFHGLYPYVYGSPVHSWREDMDDDLKEKPKPFDQNIARNNGNGNGSMVQDNGSNGKGDKKNVDTAQATAVTSRGPRIFSKRRYWLGRGWW